MRSFCGRRVAMKVMRYTPGCCCSTQLDYKVHGSSKLVWSKVNPDVECRCCFFGKSVLLAAISTELQVPCWWGEFLVNLTFFCQHQHKSQTGAYSLYQPITKWFMLACEVLVATCHFSSGIPKVSEAVRAMSS